MRAGVHISIKGEMSQPGRVAVAEEPVIGMGEGGLTGKVLDARQMQKQKSGNRHAGSMMWLVHKVK